MTRGRTAASISGTVFHFVCMWDTWGRLSPLLSHHYNNFMSDLVNCIFRCIGHVPIATEGCLQTSIVMHFSAGWGGVCIKAYFFTASYVLCTPLSLLLSGSMQWFMCFHELFPVCNGILIIMLRSVPRHIFHLCPVFSIKKTKTKHKPPLSVCYVSDDC